MERKLASIRRIKEVLPIAGADNIERVLIDGWQCVVKKGDFNPDDLCVYFEIDSFLPIRPEFEFLRKSCYRKMGEHEGFRLRTIKLKGELSQGLALPLTLLKEHPIIGYTADYPPIEERDVSNYLGVIKWEPPIPAQLAGKVKGNFPSFIRKTDQERVQNIWHKIKGVTDSFEVTVKLDGTSATYYLYNGEFGVCSRNLELKEEDANNFRNIDMKKGNTFWKIARHYDIEGLLRAYGKNIALQGEIIGEGINGNPEKIKGQDFYLFDIWNIEEQCYFTPISRRVVHETYFSSLPHVPVEIISISLSKFNKLEDILECANGVSLKSFTREGIVFKSHDSDLTFKVISNQYLLQEK